MKRLDKISSVVYLKFFLKVDGVPEMRPSFEKRLKAIDTLFVADFNLINNFAANFTLIIGFFFFSNFFEPLPNIKIGT